MNTLYAGHIYCPVVRLPGYHQDVGYQQDVLPSYYSSQELDLCQSTAATGTVTDICHGQHSCTLHADPVRLGVPACNDLHVYLKTTYSCVDQAVFQPHYLVTKPPPSTTTEMVRFQLI